MEDTEDGKLAPFIPELFDFGGYDEDTGTHYDGTVTAEATAHSEDAVDIYAQPVKRLFVRGSGR